MHSSEIWQTRKSGLKWKGMRLYMLRPVNHAASKLLCLWYGSSQLACCGRISYYVALKIVSKVQLTLRSRFSHAFLDACLMALHVIISVGWAWFVPWLIRNSVQVSISSWSTFLFVCMQRRILFTESSTLNLVPDNVQRMISSQKVYFEHCSFMSLFLGTIWFFFVIDQQLALCASISAIMHLPLIFLNALRACSFFSIIVFLSLIHEYQS